MNTSLLAALAASTEETVVAAYAAWVAGDLTDDQLIEVATAALVQAHGRAVTFADVSLAATLTAMTRVPVLAAGVAPAAGVLDRIGADVRALVASLPGLPDAEQAVRVAARAEPLAAAQDAYSAGLRERGVPSWTRVLNAGACELCQDLAGDVLPASASMFHHKGCGCSQRPVLNTEGRA